MAERIADKLSNGDLWRRFLYMVLFAIAYGVVRVVYTVVVVFQFLAILFTGHANEPLLKFGKNVGKYVEQIIRFQTFNTEDKPFPLSDWPDEEVEDNQWMESYPDDSDDDDDTDEDDVAASESEDTNKE